MWKAPTSGPTRTVTFCSETHGQYGRLCGSATCKAKNNKCFGWRYVGIYDRAAISNLKKKIIAKCEEKCKTKNCHTPCSRYYVRFMRPRTMTVTAWSENKNPLSQDIPTLITPYPHLYKFSSPHSLSLSLSLSIFTFSLILIRFFFSTVFLIYKS